MFLTFFAALKKIFKFLYRNFFQHPPTHQGFEEDFSPRRRPSPGLRDAFKCWTDHALTEASFYETDGSFFGEPRASTQKCQRLSLRIETIRVCSNAKKNLNLCETDTTWTIHSKHFEELACQWPEIDGFEQASVFHFVTC